MYRCEVIFSLEYCSLPIVIISFFFQLSRPKRNQNLSSEKSFLVNKTAWQYTKKIATKLTFWPIFKKIFK